MMCSELILLLWLFIILSQAVVLDWIHIVILNITLLTTKEKCLTKLYLRMSVFNYWNFWANVSHLTVKHFGTKYNQFWFYLIQGNINFRHGLNSSSLCLVILFWCLWPMFSWQKNHVAVLETWSMASMNTKGTRTLGRKPTPNATKGKMKCARVCDGVIEMALNYITHLCWQILTERTQLPDLQSIWLDQWHTYLWRLATLDDIIHYYSQ